MKNLIIKLLERIPHTPWWTKRVKIERVRWIERLESRLQSDRQT
jgi:hypothetical protein